MPLVCKKCGYKQYHDDTVQALRSQYPGVEERDIPYYCGACQDNATEEEWQRMYQEMNGNG